MTEIDKMNDYLDGLGDMPGIDKKTLLAIAKLDKQNDTILHDIKSKTTRMISLDPNAKERKLLYKEVDKLYKRAQAISDKKIKLADDLYEHVDVTIVEFLDKVDTYNETCVANAENKSEEENVPPGRGSNSATRVLKARDKNVSTPARHPIVLTAELPPLAGEPRYCICHNISYDKMVGCEADDCPYEWFHLACVGLTDIPEGPYWCTHCSKKKKGSPSVDKKKKKKNKRRR